MRQPAPIQTVPLPDAALAGILPDKRSLTGKAVRKIKKLKANVHDFCSRADMFLLGIALI